MWHASICTFYMVTFLLLEERVRLLLQETTFATKIMYDIADILMLSYLMMGYRKGPYQSSKHCKLVCKRSLANS